MPRFPILRRASARSSTVTRGMRAAKLPMPKLVNSYTIIAETWERLAIEAEAEAKRQ